MARKPKSSSYLDPSSPVCLSSLPFLVSEIVSKEWLGAVHLWGHSQLCPCLEAPVPLSGRAQVPLPRWMYEVHSVTMLNSFYVRPDRVLHSYMHSSAIPGPCPLLASLCWPPRTPRRSDSACPGGLLPGGSLPFPSHLSPPRRFVLMAAGELREPLLSLPHSPQMGEAAHLLSRIHSQ